MVVASLPDPSWVEAVGRLDGVELVCWDGLTPPPRDDIDVFVAPYLQGLRPIANAVQQAPTLGLVQLLTAGYDGVLAVVPDAVALANAGPVHDDSTAELAVALALAALRGIPQAVRAADDGDWIGLAGRRTLTDRRCVVVGYGGVGSGIARRAVAFGALVTAVATRARAGDTVVDAVHAIESLPTLLPNTEVLFVAVPLTPATTALVDDSMLARLPDGALVVNVARGPVVDTAAMLAHAGRLAFAVDVTDPEPLPPQHPLWSAPNVLITPHVGGATTAFVPRAVTMLRTQLAGIAAGDPPRYLVRRRHVGGHRMPRRG